MPLLKKWGIPAILVAAGFHPQSGGDRRSTPGPQVWPIRSTFRLSSFLFSLAMAGYVAGQEASALHAEAIGRIRERIVNRLIRELEIKQKRK